MHGTVCGQENQTRIIHNQVMQQMYATKYFNQIIEVGRAWQQTSN